MQDSKRDKTVKYVDRMLFDFLENNLVDGIQVFVIMKGDKGKDIAISNGSGNWYSRVGLVREWLMEIDEGVKENRRQELRNPKPEEEF